MSDTIASIATGKVRSAIGIVRLSGEHAITAAAAVFRPAGGGTLAACPSRTLVYGTLYGADGAPIDVGLATVSRAPGTYTGEDTAELQCHGAPTVLALALEALFAAGARQAGPGEFTRRAFLNGKLDLTRAEAVVDLIDAETPAAVRCAAGQLSGALQHRVEEIYDGLVDIMAHFHAVLDYPDEDIDSFGAQTLGAGLDLAAHALQALLSTYARGKLLAGGIPCAIVGSPNAGKSSLLNALLGYDRAIVTTIPGTTRDTIEERCTLGGVFLRLIDTAGLRESGDAIERMGISRSRAALAGAELVLLVVDGSRALADADSAVLDEAERAKRVICVVSKADLNVAMDLEGLRRRFPALCIVSAKTGAGLDTLEGAVRSLFPIGAEEACGEVLTNARQAEAAGRALAAVEEAHRGLALGVTPDAVLVDVEGALGALGELTGRTVREDVTSRIFSRFCVGK